MGYKSRNHYAQGESVTQEQWDSIFKKEPDGGSSVKTRDSIEGISNSKTNDGENKESQSEEESGSRNNTR